MDFEDIQELLVFEENSILFEIYLHSQGIIFSKKKERWEHNKDCSVYFYKCSGWKQLEILNYVHYNKI